MQNIVTRMDLAVWQWIWIFGAPCIYVIFFMGEVAPCTDITCTLSFFSSSRCWAAYPQVLDEIYRTFKLGTLTTMGRKWDSLRASRHRHIFLMNNAKVKTGIQKIRKKDKDRHLQWILYFIHGITNTNCYVYLCAQHLGTGIWHMHQC